jgi:hypothetical protein
VAALTPNLPSLSRVRRSRSFPAFTLVQFYWPTVATPPTAGLFTPHVCCCNRASLVGTAAAHSFVEVCGFIPAGSLIEPCSSCPPYICRSIRVHQERLQDFLDRPAAGDKLDSDSRSFLQTLLGIRTAGTEARDRAGWSVVITTDNFRTVAQVGGAFMSGLTHGALRSDAGGRRGTVATPERQTRSLALAGNVGFAIGSLIHAATDRARDAIVSVRDQDLRDQQQPPT